MKIRLAISAAAHAAVLAWGLVSFAPKAFETAPTESLPVDIVSATEFSQMVAGNRNAAKVAVPKPLVEKVGETRPTENPATKVVEKPEVVPTNFTPVPIPSPERKEQKPVAEVKAETKPKEPERKEREQKHDPIGEALKKDEKKPEPKKDA